MLFDEITVPTPQSLSRLTEKEVGLLRDILKPVVEQLSVEWKPGEQVIVKIPIIPSNVLNKMTRLLESQGWRVSYMKAAGQGVLGIAAKEDT